MISIKPSNWRGNSNQVAAGESGDIGNQGATKATWHGTAVGHQAARAPTVNAAFSQPRPPI